jgi:hypothetical protein
MAQVHVEEVKFEREVYTREFHESYYRPGNYVASKIIAEMPMTILASLSFSAVLYWCVGLNPTAIAFFFFVFVCLVNFTISQLIGCTIAAAIPGDGTLLDSLLRYSVTRSTNHDTTRAMGTIRGLTDPSRRQSALQASSRFMPL